MKPADSVEFEAVDIDALRAAHEAQTPIRAVFPGGVVFEELKAGSGAYRKYDPRACPATSLVHTQWIDYRSTLGEQFLASKHP